MSQAEPDQETEINHFNEFEENIENYRFVIRTVQASAFEDVD